GCGVVETRHSMLVSHSHPILSADCSRTRVEKVRHHRTRGECLFVLLESFHLDKANSTIAEGVVISITMRFLNDYFILEPGHISRDVECVLFISPGDAGCRAHHERRCSAGSDQCGLTT